jgi:hypothetical protein
LHLILDPKVRTLIFQACDVTHLSGSFPIP